jgi:Na+/citrate or Na+/malate symporter
VPGTYDPKKVLGVTKLDVVRAKAFIGQITGTDPKEVSIPVVGGHAGTTILPLLSQVGFAVSGSFGGKQPPAACGFLPALQLMTLVGYLAAALLKRS